MGGIDTYIHLYKLAMADDVLYQAERYIISTTRVLIGSLKISLVRHEKRRLQNRKVQHIV